MSQICYCRKSSLFRSAWLLRALTRQVESWLSSWTSYSFVFSFAPLPHPLFQPIKADGCQWRGLWQNNNKGLVNLAQPLLKPSDVWIHQPGSPLPPFNQSKPSAGSGPVLMLVWRLINLKAFKNRFTFSTGMRAPMESHHSVTVCAVCVGKNDGGLHRLFISVVPGFACLRWHPNMVGPLLLWFLKSIVKNRLFIVLWISQNTVHYFCFLKNAVVSSFIWSLVTTGP